MLSGASGLDSTAAKEGSEDFPVETAEGFVLPLPAPCPDPKDRQDRAGEQHHPSECCCVNLPQALQTPRCRQQQGDISVGLPWLCRVRTSRGLPCCGAWEDTVTPGTKERPRCQTGRALSTPQYRQQVILVDGSRKCRPSGCKQVGTAGQGARMLARLADTETLLGAEVSPADPCSHHQTSSYQPHSELAPGPPLPSRLGSTPTTTPPDSPRDPHGQSPRPGRASPTLALSPSRLLPQQAMGMPGPIPRHRTSARGKCRCILRAGSDLLPYKPGCAPVRCREALARWPGLGG